MTVTDTAWAERRAGLAAPSMRPLAELAVRLRLELDRPVPDVDPADGGTRASMLLLLERPGRAVGPVGFVSRDNPTPTARNIRRFSERAGLDRTSMVIWNTVPWLDAGALRDQAPGSHEIRRGLELLPDFLALLPCLRVVVLAGRVARLAHDTVAAARREAMVLTMPHPSPTIVCTNPAVGRRIAACLAEAARVICRTSSVDVETSVGRSGSNTGVRWETTMPAPDSLQSLYADEIKDLWSANDQMTRVVKTLAEQAHGPKLKTLLDKSVGGIQTHTASLRTLLGASGEDVEPEHCKGMEGLVKEALKHGVQEAPADGTLHDIAIITQYQRMSHYGITGFGSAATLAEALGKTQDAQTLKSIVSDIYKADEYSSHLGEAAAQAAACH